MKTFFTQNPATEENISEYSQMSVDEPLSIVKDVHGAQKEWASLTVKDRIPYFKKLAQVFREHKQELSELMTNEMGRPIAQSYWEVDTKCAGLADFIADHAESWLGDKELSADGKKHYVTFQPLGTIFIIMPWNFPYWQPIKVALLPLVAGNTVVLKHASSVTGSALALEKMFELAGFPKNVFRTIVTGHDAMPEILASQYVQAGSLTGSESAGMKFAEVAGKHIKKVVLELGGSDPLIVLDDANIDEAAKQAVNGRMFNAGQVCTAAKRIIVSQKIADQFIEKFVEQTKKLVVGDPMNMDTTIGPLVNEKAVQEMESFVQDAIDKGAVIACGGKRLDQKGYYFEPTVIVQTSKDMDVVCKEVFGPIAPIIIAKDDEDAINIANNSQYGLSSSIWSSNPERAENVAKKLETGAVFINATSKSDPRIPIGGIKRSGFGRELSEYGALEFVNIKAVNLY